MSSCLLAVQVSTHPCWTVPGSFMVCGGGGVTGQGKGQERLCLSDVLGGSWCLSLSLADIQADSSCLGPVWVLQRPPPVTGGLLPMLPALVMPSQAGHV